MNAVTFDTITYARQLENAGITREQAEIHAQALRSIIDERLVTREHLDIRMKELEYKLTIRIGSMLCGAVAVLAALITFVN